MKKFIVNAENPNGIEVEMTAEEISAKQVRDEKSEAEHQARLDLEKEQENLKASAKAKLMAGEPMTEEEANLTLHIEE